MRKVLVSVAAGLAMAPSALLAQNYAYQGTYGSPNSLQFQAVRDSLNMFDVDPADDEGTEVIGDSDTIGAAVTRSGVPHQTGERYDLHYQHTSRPFQGSRARLIIDAPINILRSDTEVYGQYVSRASTDVAGTLNTGLELPVLPNWLLTPRLSYGVVLAPERAEGDGEIGTGSLTSRFQIRHVGRGEIIIGNMIAYTRTIKLLTTQKFYSPTSNWVFRDGLAYQLPLKSRMFGRQASLRLSYVFTATRKDPVIFDQMHEVGLSIGVRTREAEQKSRFEQIRVGVLYTHSRNQYDPHGGYNAGSLTFGYRF